MAFASQHGCQPMAVAYPVKWPLGFDVLKAQYINNASKCLFAFQQPHIDKLGPNFSMTLLGSTGYTTLDPDNIEAMLSSNFEGMSFSHHRTANAIFTEFQIGVWALGATLSIPLSAKEFSPRMAPPGSILEKCSVDHF